MQINHTYCKPYELFQRQVDNCFNDVPVAWSSHLSNDPRCHLNRCRNVYQTTQAYYQNVQGVK